MALHTGWLGAGLTEARRANRRANGGLTGLGAGLTEARRANRRANGGLTGLGAGLT